MLVFQKLFITLTVALLSGHMVVRGKDIFASLGEMITLVDTGEAVTTILQEFIVEEEERIRKAKEIVNAFSEVTESSKHNPEKFIGNPINSFILIKQLSKDLQKFVDILNNFDHLKTMVHDIQENYNLPNNDDYSGAIVAIHRLEDTYQLDPTNIRKGNLSKNFPSRSLTAFECFEFGRVAYDNKDYYHTVIWMSEAYELYINNEGVNSESELSNVLDYLAFATAQQGNIKHAIDLTEELLEIDPDHQRAIGNLKYYRKNLKEQMKKLLGDVEVNNMSGRDPTSFENERSEALPGSERDIYEFLCRENNIKNTDSRLKCRYINYNPLLYIAPVKEELASIDPNIWLYHDIITDEQINAMIELAKPRLKRAMIRNPISGVFETADYRVSKSTWLNDADHESFPYLTQTIEAITNLSLSTAEEWQIANYGIGGQYEPHFDYARKTEPADAFDTKIGNRIATWMFYLDAPEEGGETVFTEARARISPLRGSAVFWYNLLPSGEGDFRTRHAACPVLYGSKWVSNKWLHMGGQEFKRPCNLLEDII